LEDGGLAPARRNREIKAFFAGPQKNISFRQQPPRPVLPPKAGTSGSHAATELGSKLHVLLATKGELVSLICLKSGPRDKSTVCPELQYQRGDELTVNNRREDSHPSEVWI